MALTVELITLPTPVSSGGYHVAGPTPAGPYDQAIRLESMGQYRRLFGTRTPETSAVYDDLELFFAEGGEQAYLTRTPPEATPEAVVAALDATAAGLTGTAVATPSYPADAIGPHLIAHAGRTGRIALLATDAVATVADVTALTGELAGEEHADHAGLFWPWVVTTSRLGERRAVSPCGFVAAARARAHRTGYWVHPAGGRARVSSVTGLLAPVDREDAWELADHLVSGICSTAAGVQLWGWWSLAGDRAHFAHLSARDLLNNVAAELSRELADRAQERWASVEQSYSRIWTTAVAVLARLAAAGAFTPSPDPTHPDEGYRLAMVMNPQRTAVELQVDVRSLQYTRLVGAQVYRIPLSVPIPRSTI